MRLPEFEFHQPTSLDEVRQLLGAHGDTAMLMAGGTDVLPGLKLGRRTCEHVVWLKGVPGLDVLAHDPERGLTIGATALLADVGAFAGTRTHYPALAEAIRTLATVQTRFKATVVGNICNASPCADTATPLLAYGAIANVIGHGGRRELPLENFFLGPRNTALEAGELIESLVVPPPQQGMRAVFLKFSPRSKVDIAAVNVTVALIMQGEAIGAARVYLGTVAPTPVRAPKTEALLVGAQATPELFEQAARTARTECSPITDHRATKEYKTHMVGVLVKRALAQLVEQA